MLTAAKLSYTIAGTRLLRDITLTVNPGEVLALIGPNGAGKSTFLKLLSGELRPTAGVITLEGEALKKWSKLDYARKRAVMPQSTVIAFPFTVFEVVLLGRSPHIRGFEDARDHAITLSAMRLTEVQELALRYYDTLSGGEKQRVQFARALTQIWGDEQISTRYLFLDEPVAGMDPAHQHAALKIAREFSRREVGVLVVLHDINLAAMYADRIAVFQGGNLYHYGTPDQVLTEPLIKEVFDLDVMLQRHPIRGCSVVIPSPSDIH
ncbi:MAG: heme ABC transporter ATP-binding protein [Gammaproteobacteria bacterium]|nr:heme ABC transporter ATP-binding protein [Gammaproteobacteria bacterium]MCY4282598.1 heme ABC transporter ATP-binding protein [Gammaproteobacteria bacterium]